MKNTRCAALFNFNTPLFMAMLWKQVKIYKWACGQVINVDLNFVPYRYIISLVKQWLSDMAKGQLVPEQLVSIPDIGQIV